MRAPLILTGVIASIAGCTFAGLGNYDIPSCDPNAATDACAALNSSSTTCQAFQCSKASRTCVKGPRDDDRDGDPSIACGGTDCDDHDPSNSGIGTEICDSKDNNCNGLIDEDLLKQTSSTSVLAVGVLPGDSDVGFTSGAAVVGAFAAPVSGNGRCLSAVSVESTFESGCDFLANETTLLPRQPAVVPIGSGHAAVFVDASKVPCLDYRYNGTGTAGSAAVTCTDPAALPTLASFQDNRSALLAWYGTSLASRTDPIQQCTTASPAPLLVARVASASTGSPTLGKTLTLTTTSTSMRPPATAQIPGGSQLLVAAPDAAAVSVWALGADETVPAPTTIASLGNARGVALATATVSGTTRVAVVAELGCAPQSIALSVASGTGAFGVAAEVVPAGATGELATQPTVAWIAARNEWLVSWISTHGGTHVAARRFTPDGKAIGAVIDTPTAGTAAAVTPDGDLLAFVPDPNANVFVDSKLACTP